MESTSLVNRREVFLEETRETSAPCRDRGEKGSTTMVVVMGTRETSVPCRDRGKKGSTTMVVVTGTPYVPPPPPPYAPPYHTHSPRPPHFYPGGPNYQYPVMGHSNFGYHNQGWVGIRLVAPMHQPDAFDEEQQAKKVRNDVKVHKDSVKVEVDELNPDHHLLSFVFDALFDGRY
ncbi:hypothetical protein AgCh_018441 [Apium graveolens]